MMKALAEAWLLIKTAFTRQRKPQQHHLLPLVLMELGMTSRPVQGKLYHTRHFNGSVAHEFNVSCA
jgi:hypothetical protein